MAESLQIGSMNHRHEGVLRWLLANPERPLSDCARELGYTRTHLSIIIHSDAFQARLREAQGDLAGEIALSIQDKLTGLAHASLDRLAEQLPIATDPKLVLDVAERALENLGYGAKSRVPQPPGIGSVNVFVGQSISGEELARARAAAQAARVVPQEEPVALPMPATS